MENTLNDYIRRADEINFINNKASVQKYHNEFLLMITFMDKALNALKVRYNTFKKFNNIVDFEEDNNDHEANGGNENIENNKNQNKTNTKKTYQKIAIKNKINIRYVPNQPNQLDVKLNWISELNQYSLQINNLTLRGNIGNIYNKKILLDDSIKAHQVIPCYKKNKCSNILSQKYCKYWHDPVDLILLREANIISNEFYNQTIKFTRNFSNVSWVYSDNKNFSKVIDSTRTIGSRNSLYNDMMIYKLNNNKDQIEEYKAQVMHDILVLIFLSEHGF
jgi:hypothetical protein